MILKPGTLVTIARNAMLISRYVPGFGAFGARQFMWNGNVCIIISAMKETTTNIYYVLTPSRICWIYEYDIEQ